MRPSGRAANALRTVNFRPNFALHAEGSCLVEFGNTHVLCTASIEEKIPPFLRGSGLGWVTAEYGMLPRSTHTRSDREAAKGKQSGRTQEIQRLIGRSLRAITNRKLLGERQIIVDCDVLQADGGTRTASITGGYIALALACKRLQKLGILAQSPLNDSVAAISCGIFNNECVLDLDYPEDSKAGADTNFVLTGGGKLIEVQGTAEETPFSEEQFLELMALARQGCADLTRRQREVLDNAA